jgi:signal peptidase I
MDDRPLAAASRQELSRAGELATPAGSNGAPAQTQHSSETATKDAEHKKDEGSVKETIEQILVAFILAFVFRAFVVEAFVIPTGSMAPTLLGAHMRFTCDDCGYQFDVNYNTGSPDDMNIPSFAPGGQLAICPNCGYHIPARQRGDQAFDPPVRYGDRILVLKYLYLFEDPKRWDVVVFKSPDVPQRYDYQQNYIKRLIGKPNESIMILDGDIYVGDRDAQPERMKIQHKPPQVQDAMWRIIYDNDYHPRGELRSSGQQTWHQPWMRRGGGSGWDLGDVTGTASNDGGRTFRFDNTNGVGEIFFNDELNQPMDVGLTRGGRYVKSSALFDWLAYDVDAGPPFGGWSPVGDLKLDFFYERLAGEGPLRLVLTKRDDVFVAEIGPNSARLLRQDAAGNDVELIPAAPIAQHGGPMHVEFSNVDYVVSLRIDGREVFRTTDQQYSPDIAGLLDAQRQSSLIAKRPAIRIVASNQTASVKHLSLWRDIYYLSRGRRPVDGEPYAASPDNIMRLGPDEFFVMGDNSQISGDGRYWTEPIDLPWEDLHIEAGRVPARFMLGKAFFVYWPAGYRPMESLPALAPNFGDMRFIH